MNRYEGILVPSKMGKLERRAYLSFVKQRERCNYPSCPKFKDYGAVGIKLEYDAREFIPWYVSEFKKRPNWKWPTVGRIDHSKNYSFDNIELVEMSENSKERIKRRGFTLKPIAILAKNVVTGQTYKFNSVREAENMGIFKRSTINNQLSGRQKTNASGWIFERSA